MTSSGFAEKLRWMRRLAVPLAVAILCAVLVSAPLANSAGLKVTSVSLPGVSGGANNVVFDDRYALVAPFSPSKFGAFAPLPDGSR